jgi:hypothetical protein
MAGVTDMRRSFGEGEMPRPYARARAVHEEFLSESLRGTAPRPPRVGEAHLARAPAPPYGRRVALYIVSRTRAWATDEELDASVDCAAPIMATFAPDIRWIRSYLVREADGALSAVCVYEAASEDVVRRYSEAARLPFSSIAEVERTIVRAPDPEPIAVL